MWYAERRSLKLFYLFSFESSNVSRFSFVGRFNLQHSLRRPKDTRVHFISIDYTCCLALSMHVDTHIYVCKQVQGYAAMNKTVNTKRTNENRSTFDTVRDIAKQHARSFRLICAVAPYLNSWLFNIYWFPLTDICLIRIRRTTINAKFLFARRHGGMRMTWGIERREGK